ncbi:MAG: GNAT family N-acetyltransferase [Chloroflexi bacterium]|nr:GNAT family N-acetyltransferase [Chloroflexota bacterium]
MSLKPQILKQQFTLAETNLPRDLGDGLVLRLATAADAEAVAQFNAANLGRDPVDQQQVAAWTRDFCSESHPTCGPSNVTMVEDTRAGKIVSSMCLIPQTWTYAGIPFGVGRPEAVSTDPEYRRRGLVREQFAVHHTRSAAMGHLAQGITGIPWYYRQFGYEYALNLGGGRLVLFGNITPLKEGESEPYRLRPLTAADLPFVKPLYEREGARSLVACPRPDWLWNHLLFGYSEESFENRPFQIVETGDGRAVGYLAPSREMGHDMYAINELAVAEGESYRALMPSVLRGLEALAERQAAEQNKAVNTLYLQLGPEHPVYTAIPDKLTGTRPRYGWYIRVADVPALIRHIAPALENRLAKSPLAGHTGELKINEYTGGLNLVFEKGKLVTAEPWHAGGAEWHRAAFPPRVFLQLLFGFNSLAEIRAASPDAIASGDDQVLLEALFPRQSSSVVPVG